MNEGESANAAGPLSDAERQAYEARIADLERRRRSVEELTRFRLDAYKARLAELKQDEARHLAEKARLERELDELRRRHDALARELARRGGQSVDAGASKGQGR